jgi:RNA 3'-terminal phosphate cyclase (ATP)
MGQTTTPTPTIQIGTGPGTTAVDAGMTPLAATLALAAITGRPFSWDGYRRRGKGPAGFREGESRAVRLFVEMSGATVSGGGPGETELGFHPGALRAGAYRVELEGSEPLLALARLSVATLGFAPGTSELVARGSTHDIDGDTFEGTSSTWIHLVRRIGLDVDLHLDTVGFTPRGGGEMRFDVRGGRADLAHLALDRRGELDALQIVSGAASLPAHVQQRQAARARSGVQIAGTAPSVQLLKLRAAGSGSVVAITGVFGGLPITLAAIAERGVSAESVGEKAAGEFRRLFAGTAVLPPHLLPSLLVALAAGAREPSVLTTTRLPSNVAQLAALVEAFTGRGAAVEGKPGRAGAVAIDPRS